jgi:proteasome accessory factor A
VLTNLEKDPMGLDREVDWVIKHHVIERYRERWNLPLSSPRVGMLDLSYHHVHAERGVFEVLQRRGLVERMVGDDRITRAMDVPPQTTRARLRGSFIAAAKAARRDYTVDWVHLKLNDQAQRTVLCKDPLVAVDDRVDKLIASL